MFYSDDPVRDFDRYDAYLEKQKDKLPKCVDCGEPITEDHFYLINDEAICPKCLENNYRKWVDDYIE